MIVQDSFDIEATGKAGGWTIREDGRPYLWWSARLKHFEPIRLSDGTDARDHDVQVIVNVGAETALGQTLYTGGDKPTPKFGFLICSEHAEIWAQLWLSAENVDRIMRSMLSALPPTVTVGFGPNEYGAKLTGSITRAEHGSGYVWHNDEPKGHIVVETVEFTSLSPALDDDPPDTPDDTPAFLRALGIAWAVVVNVIAVAVAFAVLNTASSRFETAIVSVLLLIYVTIISVSRGVRPVLIQLELASVVRFLQLRTLLGRPMSASDKKHLATIRDKIDRLGPRFWIDSAGITLIGVLVLDKLAILLL